ncbi:FAD dependent oxidoreductase TIGR03364 [Pedobacter steynii]|uniref:FAD dependent oxidoreductase TIGR03364 n=1 Tax=Pedobacter steynii TaxID=430522 RepID=A0A1G9SMS4_9SPHI|nr:TIGR03364 family FAD-dependent oxidoreductase [Pedobacter steynii]NQX37371.1 TIGR03364 family FAD-dependent oxidoreductase [Pedobacter steynii]SDM36627.1 FAD dependent oxidoreductase TIGR03364 [Pedobacter steynii]
MSTKHYDLIVIGGGILGTFHAYHALKNGKKVLQLEKDNYPVGATVRNFGQVIPSGMTGVWFDYGVRGLEIYQEIQQEFDISVRKNGSVYIASDEEEQNLIHELKAHYDTLGYTQQLLGKAQILTKYPAIRSSYAKEALLFDQEISVDPTAMIYRLQEFMRGKFENYTLMCNSPVVDCVANGKGAEVRLSRGDIYSADKAVLCNGYEFKLLFPALFEKSGQVISKLQMMRTVPMPKVELEGNILTGLTIRRYESFEEYCPSFKNLSIPEHYRELKEWGIHLLLKKAEDGSFIIGDSHEYADVNHFDELGFNVKQHINELMLKEGERIVNFNLRDMATTWAGFYPQHPTEHILEYDIEDCIHIRTCIGGKGMTASAGYTEASLKKILGI